MQVTLDVIDSMSAAPLQGATIAINGQSVGQTDVNGVYQAEVDESDQVTVSYVGYTPYSISAGILEGSGQVQLSKSGATLPTVTVTPSPKSSSLLPWLIAGGALAVVSSGGNKKSVGKISKKTGTLIGVGALGLAAVYLIAKKPSTTIQPIPSTGLTANKSTSLLPSASSLVSSITSGSGFLSSISNLFGAGSGSGNATTDTQVVDPTSSYDLDTQSPGNIDPGYSGMTLDFSGAPVSGIGRLWSDNETMGDITTYLPWIAAGGIGLLLLSKKKVGSADFSGYILPIGILVGGYLVLSKLGLFNPTAGDQNASSIAKTTAAGVSSTLDSLKSQGDAVTITQAQAATLASTIFNAGVSSPVDMDTIQNSVIQANSLSDFLLIVQAFGTKQAGGTACSIWGNLLSSTCATYDLPSYLRATLDQSHISTINNYFSSQGINYSI